MRQAQTSKRELWAVRRTGESPVERLLFVGDLLEGYAISPNGKSVAASIRVSPDNEPELRVIDMVSGATIARLGPGAVSAGAWLPDGTRLVCVAKDDSNIPQLWLVDASERVARWPLTRIDDGLRPIVAVSRDGRWAAGLLKEDTPALVLIPLPERDAMVALDAPLIAIQGGA
jgi:hypothetical protein